MRVLMRKHPVSSYFVLTFILSWGAVLAVIGGGAIPAPAQEADRLFPFVYLGMLLGPVGAGLIMTAIVGGLEGLRELGHRLTTWRIEGRWVAVALGTAPVVLMATLVVLSALPGDFTPQFLRSDGPGLIGSTNPVSFIFVALTIGLGAGFFEEIGWTGFATPRLLRRGVAGILMLGMVWGAWHFLPTWWGSGDAFGSIPVPVYLLLVLFSFLPPYRILMVWMYEQTRSLPLAALMHASLTSSMLILGPAVTGIDSVLYNLVFSVLLWCVVAITGRVRSRRRILPAMGAPGLRGMRT